MSERFSESYEHDRDARGAGPETGGRYERPPVRDADDEVARPREAWLGHVATARAAEDDMTTARDDDVARLRVAPAAGRLAVAGVEEIGSPMAAHPRAHPNDANDVVIVSPRSAAGTRTSSDSSTLAEGAEVSLRDVEPGPRRAVTGSADDPYEIRLRQSPSPRVEAADAQGGENHDSWVAGEVIAERTTANRIDLADDVDEIELKPTYDGYLDVVMHGDQTGTQADVKGDRIDFSLSQTAQMIESSPTWDHRPIRLLSCSTGQESYAQDLADRLKVPVYAPNGVLEVAGDGKTSIDSPDGTTDGAWRRFEPRQ